MKTILATLVAAGLCGGAYFFLHKPAPCKDDFKVCPNGMPVSRSGSHCRMSPCVDDGLLYLELLWNTPLHSWTGVASEAVDFLVPLADRLPNLSVVGGYNDDYAAELAAGDIQVIKQLRAAGELIASKHKDAKVADPLQHSVLLTQYDPGTYMGDLERYNAKATFDVVIGRVMFETTGIPSNWIEPCSQVDELWVPSKWGAERIVAAGIPAEKVFVIPQAVDVLVFDPHTVKHDHELLPGSKDVFSFLSIFKWEERKNYIGLLTAFLTAFDGDTKVGLFIRSGNDPAQLKWVVEEIILQTRVKYPPKVVWVPKVSTADFPQLYATADAFVLPTHGEGWGRPIMEAMAMEMPVIATYWSGTTEFLTDDNAFLLRPTGLEDGFTQQPQLINWDQQSNHQWASVSDKDLAKLMKYVKLKSNRHIVSLVAKRARSDVVRRFSREAVADVVLEKLVRTHKGILEAKATANAQSNQGNHDPAYGRKGF